MDILWLRLDAPLMSFGGVAVDQLGVNRGFPATSMLTGLLANALGYDHGDAHALERLQQRLRYAVRRDREGQAVVDYQTADLGQPYLAAGWTTWGKVDGRGGASATGTHQRYRHYWAGAVYTVALTLDPVAEAPTVDALEAALREPVRPLFLGRKPCLPSVPLLLGRATCADLLDGLARAPVLVGTSSARLKAWWPAESAEAPADGPLIPLTDHRDWQNQIHVGRRFLREGQVELKGGEAHE